MDNYITRNLYIFADFIHSYIFSPIFNKMFTLSDSNKNPVYPTETDRAEFARKRELFYRSSSGTNNERRVSDYQMSEISDKDSQLTSDDSLIGHKQTNVNRSRRSDKLEDKKYDMIVNDWING